MYNIYEAIKTLDSKGEITTLRTFFTNNPEKKVEAEHILPTCEDNEEVVAYFKDLLKPDMFSLSRVIFANNTKHLLKLAFFFLLFIINLHKKHIHVIVDQSSSTGKCLQLIPIFPSNSTVAKSGYEFLVCCEAPGIEDANLQLEGRNHSSYQETKKEIFKKLLYVLGSYIKSNINFIQTFLSGTALQDVVQQKELTIYTFDYINYPLLSMTACIEIVDHFAKQYGDTEFRWYLDRPFIKILDDARGLPRAIEYILNDVLGTSHNNAKKFSGIESKVNIFNNHPIASSGLQFQKVLMNDDNCLFTYGKLERDQHIILEEINKQLSITMPVYFIYLYNKVLKLADGILANMLKPDSDGMETLGIICHTF
ncbi:19920_t:CDS:2 [Funneliformis geosporum]|uniref:19920_t:CDS:1 n=1 Tax=Funneliformis geosporum TaxID=1117311 RepID=A0A9W4X1S0_9GLOM|nr:19920_t:CDS:2 [Funneliformis geosporum]